jgi:hypothetical protein
VSGKVRVESVFCDIQVKALSCPLAARGHQRAKSTNCPTLPTDYSAQVARSHPDREDGALLFLGLGYFDLIGMIHHQLDNSTKLSSNRGHF